MLEQQDFSGSNAALQQVTEAVSQSSSPVMAELSALALTFQVVAIRSIPMGLATLTIGARNALLSFTNRCD